MIPTDYVKTDLTEPVLPGITRENAVTSINHKNTAIMMRSTIGAEIQMYPGFMYYFTENSNRARLVQSKANLVMKKPKK